MRSMLALAAIAAALHGGATADASVTVVDVRASDYSDQLTATCLQGIANRDSGRVFLLMLDTDTIWRDEYAKRYGVHFAPALSLEAVLEAQTTPANGLVLWDPAVPDTAHVAACYASVEDMLPVTESQLRAMPSLRRLPVRQDLRGRFDGMSKPAVYRWVLTNLYPRCARACLFNQNTPAGPEEGRAADGGWATNLTRDYVVAHRGVHIDLSSAPSTPEERELKGEFFDGLDHLGYVLGWHTWRDSEADHVAQASESAKLVMCSGAANFSFYEHIPATRPFRGRGKPPEGIRPEPGKAYVCFTLSDGDALHWVAGFQGGQWLMPERGAVPFGWEVQPLLSRMAPGMLQYYCDAATDSDCLVASASGVGYVYPNKMLTFDETDYLLYTKEVLAECDMDTLTVLPWVVASEATTLQYARILGPEVRGCFEGYSHLGTEPRLRNGFTWLPAELPLEGRSGRGELLADIRGIAAQSPGETVFIPVHAFCYETTIADCAWVASQLDSERFRVVRPDALLALYAAANEGTVRVITPEPTLLIAGRENRVECRLRSMASTGLSVDATWELPAELGGRTAGRTELPAGERGAVSGRIFAEPSVAGMTHRVRVTVRYAGHETVRDLDLEAIPPPSGLPQDGVLAHVRTYEAEDMPGRVGEVVADPDAHGGRARRARAGAGSRGHLVFGPYDASVLPGQYVALFRMKVGENSSAALACTIDAAHAPTMDPTVQRELASAAFTRAGAYEYFALPFERIARGQMEFRVLSTGTADLTVDCIDLLRLERP